MEERERRGNRDFTNKRYNIKLKVDSFVYYEGSSK